MAYSEEERDDWLCVTNGCEANKKDIYMVLDSMTPCVIYIEVPSEYDGIKREQYVGKNCSKCGRSKEVVELKEFRLCGGCIEKLPTWFKKKVEWDPKG